MSIEATVQKLTPSAKIDLYRIDTTKVGGGVFYFTPTSQAGGSPVYFGGVAYTPIDIEVEGYEINAGGALPTPTMRLDNRSGVPQALVNTYGDLLGSTVQRIRTYAEHLDGEPNADPSSYLGPDTFEIERKTAELPEYIEWQLSAAIDQEGKQLPGRTVVRDTCMWRYRTWNAETGRFNYTRVTCPYAGDASFDRSGNTAQRAKDDCGRRVSDCELRFGVGKPLPFGGFPGAARVRQ